MRIVFKYFLHFNYLFLLFFLFFLFTYCNSFAEIRFNKDVIFEGPIKNIDDKFFGLHAINMEWGASWPKVQFATWRNFRAQWKNISPSRGRWDFALIDKEVFLARKNNVELMLVLGSTPVWASREEYVPSSDRYYSDVPSNLDDWRTYIRTVAERYKGKVLLYELWNEPNVGRFFSGTVADLIILNREAYRILKQVDSNIIVVSSAMATAGPSSLQYFDEFLKCDGGQFADVIGYHFYVCPKSPEALVDDIQNVKLLMQKYNINKPLWNTETGWNISNIRKNDHNDEAWCGQALDEKKSVAYVARSYILCWVAGVERFYWYAWGHRRMGLSEYDAVTPKASAFAYNEIQKWLIGARIEFCSKQSDSTWVCKLRRGDGYEGTILWNTVGSTSFRLPFSSSYPQRLRRLNGTVEILPPFSDFINLDMAPILIESQI